MIKLSDLREEVVAASSPTSLRDSVRKLTEQYQAAGLTIMSLAQRARAVRLQSIEAFQIASPKIDTTAELLKKVGKAMESIFPSNWPRPLPDQRQIDEVLEADGIPIVHIPRASIVREIIDAADYDARIAVIEDRADEIVSDCEAVVRRDLVEELSEQAPLAVKAVDAYQAGHFEAAQALAVAVCDT